ncbi:hypothetical protein STCU_03522 [Strigomonas culicis]|uniref:ADF-H domain-containing protein n=1 Tax=Strigomonas culicis TaxID=28005 RepID=S9VW87_9TRYP|nr:hypothetical protein STCU_03522 [Strigomonas culicis]|eukprot:EPY31306.1 hypothetical protein STCU_03522 [Strigomonas culicis]
MAKVSCTARGFDEISSAMECLDETKVQLLFSKFPVGTGTFKRNKFIYVQYIGPKCGIVKRGKAINDITAFTAKNLHGVAGFSTTDKQNLTFEYLVEHMKDVFVTDNGTFSLDQIKEEYRTRLKEERKMMHREGEAAAAAAAKKKMALEAAKRQVRVPAPKPPPATPEKKEEMNPKEWSELTQRVLANVREDDGPVNWAVFTSEDKQLRVRSYGRGGIFEMVKNLPEDMWLFGLFRISFNIGSERQRRIIFFQWIGSKLKAVRGSNRAGIYPSMAKALAPYSYEIYLVGQNDLHPQAIINKSKNAFSDVSSPSLVADGAARKTINFTEEGYKVSLQSEQEELKDVQFEPFVPAVPEPRRNSVVSDDTMESSLLMLSLTGFDNAVPTRGNFDVEETLRLIQMRGGRSGLGDLQR